MEHNNNFTTPEKSTLKKILPKALLISLLTAAPKNGTNITQVIKDNVQHFVNKNNPHHQGYNIKIDNGVLIITLPIKLQDNPLFQQVKSKETKETTPTPITTIFAGKLFDH